MSAMRIAGKLCKPKLVVKLIVLVGVVSPFVVFLLRNGDSENNQQDLQERHNELRHVLNTYEDDRESLQAPTTKRSLDKKDNYRDEIQNEPPPVPEKKLKLERSRFLDNPQPLPYNDRSTKKPSFKGYKLNQPNPKYYGGTEDDFNDQKHLVLGHASTTESADLASETYQSMLKKSNFKPLDYLKKVADRSEKKSKLNYIDYAGKPVKKFEKNKNFKNLEYGEKPAGKPEKPRAKQKQWETYDYEDPNNLLQIHVDRAPDHQDGAGQPWPMPQAYRAENISLVVDVDGFTIQRPVKTCNRVNRAIARYTNHINSKIDLFIPDGEKLQPLSQSNGRVLRQLKVSMSRPCDDDDLPHEHMSEQYKLVVSGAEATLSAQEPWGVIRGLETFSQLIYFSSSHARVNVTFIKDYPRFSFRGLMLDTARHYIPVRYLKRTLDAMSYNKLNVFHWHMVDDQSFPYESKVFPKLSIKGAYSANQIYTHADIRQLIDYAADRAIRIVPEFDSPGHTRSWGLGYPELLTNCSADYYPFGAVNPLSKYTYQFMTTFWREIADLFPDSTVHVGGDEINYKCWLRLQYIRDFMITNNMTLDNYDFLTLDGDKLQGYYLKHLIDVMPKERKKIAWEEAFNAAKHWNISTDELIINVWKGGDYEWQYTMENIVRQGYKAILSAPWYLNYISYGRDWTKYYTQDPHTFLNYASGNDISRENVIGGQVCMWMEFIDESNLEPTLWPRASSPAEKLWSSAEMTDWKKAEARFEHHRCRMSRRGIKTQPNSGPGSCRGTMKIKPPYEAAQQYFN